MSWNTRIDIYKTIEEHRKRPLIVYVTSKREGTASLMATDALPYIIEQIDALPLGSENVDFLIASYGGDPMVAWRIISLLEQRGLKNIAVLIPQSAYSAATLVSFGANEIIMHPNGHVGPVDMQITTYSGDGGKKSFSTEDISAFLDFVRDHLKITDQEHIRILFETTCKEVGSLGIGFTARSSKLAIDLGERLLARHMVGEENRSKARNIVENMSRKFQSHSYPVNRGEAIEMGLPVKEERDPELEKLMWQVWLDIEQELKENEPFHPVLEALKSNQGSKLIAPVPQIYVPAFAAGGHHYQATIADVKKAVQDNVDPVDFDLKNAVVESSRLAHANNRRGKILTCRNPDLMINWNMVTTFRGWEKQVTKAEK